MSFKISNFTNGLTSRMSPAVLAAGIAIAAFVIVPYVKRRFFA